MNSNKFKIGDKIKLIKFGDVYTVEKVEGKVEVDKVEQEASGKDIRPRKNKVETIRIIIVPPFFDT